MKEIKSARIANAQELYKFAEKIKQMPECKNLTPDQKLKIIFAYPIKIEIV